MWRTISLSLLSVVCMFGATGALADIASAGYVQEIVDSLRVQSDWMQTNPDALDYIKNKPINHEIVDNKVTVLSADVTDEQYPSVRAVMHGELLDPQMVVFIWWWWWRCRSGKIYFGAKFGWRRRWQRNNWHQCQQFCAHL